VIFEPFGGSNYELAVGDWLKVEVGGDAGGEVEVSHETGSITLWLGRGWGYLSAENRAGERLTQMPF
jgi:hypothetical protein